MNLSKDVLAGTFFLVVAAITICGAVGLDIGSPEEMGPGYFPLTVGVLLAMIAVAVMFKGVKVGSAVELSLQELRGAGLIFAAVFVFAWALDHLGLPITVLVTTFVAMKAQSQASLKRIASVGLCIALFCWLTFGFALDLHIPLLPSW